MADQHRFLVVGCGSIGKRHIKNLRDLGGVEILAYDPAAARREEVRTDLGIAAVDRLSAAWEHNPSVCVVATPTALHLQLALEAADRGCHLFIEKPLSHSEEGLAQLLGRVRDRGLITLVGCNMRFHPGLAKIKQLLEENAVGRVIALRVDAGQYLPDWHPWEDYRQSYSARRDLGGGVILDAIHELDYVRWLAGEVVGAFCLAGKLSHLEIDTEDTAAMLLRFANGAMGEVHLDYVQRAYHRTCQVIGDEGTLHWDYAEGQVRWYSSRTKAWQVFANPPDWQPNQMYVDEMAHFLRCLARAETPALDVFDAARVLKIALAAKQSGEQQRWMDLGSDSWNQNATL